MDNTDTQTLEDNLRAIFSQNSIDEARDTIGALVGTLDAENQQALNLICSRLFEEKAKENNTGEYRYTKKERELYLCAIRCALSINDRERVYQILDDDRANLLMRAYANRSVGPVEMNSPIDIFHDLLASNNKESKFMSNVLEDYFVARGKDPNDYKQRNYLLFEEVIDDLF